MALYDHERRVAQDYIHDAPNNDNTRSAFSGFATAAFIFVIGLLLIVFAVAPSQDPTGGITRSPAPTTTTAPTNAPAPATK